jgi:hypothetical protein
VFETACKLDKSAFDGYFLGVSFIDLTRDEKADKKRADFMGILLAKFRLIFD